MLRLLGRPTGCCSTGRRPWAAHVARAALRAPASPEGELGDRPKTLPAASHETNASNTKPLVLLRADNMRSLACCANDPSIDRAPSMQRDLLHPSEDGIANFSAFGYNLRCAERRQPATPRPRRCLSEMTQMLLVYTSAPLGRS